ncbi:MAG: hypothetical protein ABMA13_06245 [Chthoniobacteraceae bacterium]
MNTKSPGRIALFTLAATLGFLALPALDARAEDAKGKAVPGWLQKEVDKVTVVVPDLNEEQKTKLADAISVRTEAVAKAKASGAAADELKARTKDAWSAYFNEAKTFLTDSQFAKFTELHKPKPAASK